MGFEDYAIVKFRVGHGVMIKKQRKQRKQKNQRISLYEN
jgi:hypothetical protein